jgi:hypothetical protein
MDAIRIIEDEKVVEEKDEDYDEDLDEDFEDDFETEASETEDEYSW